VTECARHQTTTRLRRIHRRTRINRRDLRQTLSTQLRQVQIDRLASYSRSATGCGAAA
jgi:hypothetical protein